jgi:tRNA pseudouridine32 synthase / 23S rRNA pseudouridine746 synthase
VITENAINVPPLTKHLFFTSFTSPTSHLVIPEHFVLTRDGVPHALCCLAAEELQSHLKTQTVWNHNFGLAGNEAGIIIGKMFGVLVVMTSEHQLGYLAAFSGKLAGGNHHAKFVPPVFDSLTTNSFLNLGMEKLTRMNADIKNLTTVKSEGTNEQLHRLKTMRKKHSVSLQHKLFDHYHFVNQAGREKSLNDIFKKALRKNPPSGAGECAAPKLLQYAFQHQLKPLAMAEFWWGQSPKSGAWKHGHYYPTCNEKCGPILEHMLSE